MFEQTGKGDDDFSISSDEVVFRRVKSQPSMLVRDSITGSIRPSSGAFRPDDDGISVYREQSLRAVALGPPDLRITPDDLVFGLEVGDARALALDVRDDPWPTGIADEVHPRNAAHALIVGFETLSRGQRKRKQDGLVRAPSLRQVID